MKNWIIGLIFVIIGLIAGLVYGVETMRIDWLQAIMVVFTFYGMVVIFIAAVFKPKVLDRDDSYQPYVSILVAARNEEFVISGTIHSLMKLDYHIDGKPNYEVIVMDDNSQDRTFEIASSLKTEFENLKVIHRGPDIGGRGKSDALNHGLREAKGDVIGVFDADADIAPDFLKQTIPLLGAPGVGGVQGRVRLYNRNKNILTMLQEDEFAIISHLYQIGKDQFGGLTALGGNGQVVRREALLAVNGWNYMSPTEDLDLTFRLLFAGWEVRYCPNAVLWQEGVEKPWAFIRQRVRWAEGFLKCIFDYSAQLLSHKIRFMKKLDGVMTMGRVLIPFYVWIGYLFIVFSIMKEVEFRAGISSTFLMASTYFFFFSMTIGMFKTMYPNIFTAFFRAFLYSIYGAFWVIAVPLGFYNCIKNIDDICWDKTVHTGSADDERVQNAIDPAYQGTEIIS